MGWAAAAGGRGEGCQQCDVTCVLSIGRDAKREVRQARAKPQGKYRQVKVKVT